MPLLVCTQAKTIASVLLPTIASVLLPTIASVLLATIARFCRRPFYRLARRRRQSQKEEGAPLGAPSVCIIDPQGVNGSSALSER